MLLSMLGKSVLEKDHGLSKPMISRFGQGGRNRDRLVKMIDDSFVDQKYSIDTCSLIDGHPNTTSRIILENLIRRDRLKSPPGVLRELEVGSDEVFKWAKYWEKSLIKELSPASASRLGHLVANYGEPFSDPEYHGKTYLGLIKKEKACDADPEVIALALDYDWTVVSEERRGIKGACKVEGVTCISLEELLKIETPREERQLPLI